MRRLRKPEDYAAWKATHNELLVPYFFAKAFGLTISFTIVPTQKGQGDFQIIHPKGRVIVEVKTPRGDDPNLEGPQGGAHWGWDEELIKPVFLDAAGQLRRGNLNLVVICTHLCTRIHDSMPFERLLYGEDIIAATFDPETGNVGEPRTEFRPNGELLRHKPKRYTRISAVASLRTDAYCDGPFDLRVIQVQFAVLHNCHASCPISAQVFRRAEQFLPKRKGIKHVGEKRSSILLYITEGWSQNIVESLRVSIHLCCRWVRRLRYRGKIRRIAEATRSEVPDDFDDHEKSE